MARRGFEGLSAEIEVLAREGAGCERLMSVPGIGPIISKARTGASVELHSDERKRRFIACVDVYGPRPIATVFGMFRIDGHNCRHISGFLMRRDMLMPRASMGFRPLPPQWLQDIGRSHAGPHTRFGKRRGSRFLHLLPIVAMALVGPSLGGDGATVVALYSSTHSPVGSGEVLAGFTIAFAVYFLNRL